MVKCSATDSYYLSAAYAHFIVSMALNQTPNIASTIMFIHEKNQCITWFAKFKSTVATACMEGNLHVPN